MHKTKQTLFFLLALFSLLLGYAIGKLDFFSFFDFSHQIQFALLITILLLWYIISIVIFLLDLTDKKNLFITYGVSSLLFGTGILVTETRIVEALFSTVFFFGFLFFTYKETLRRSQLFVKFRPNNIFTPVVRLGFTFLLVILALLTFFQAQNRQLARSIITEDLVRSIGKPIVLILNKQLAAQLQLQLGDKFEKAIGSQTRSDIVHFMLDETLEAMTEGKTRQLFGINPQTIPLQKTTVYGNGEIDLMPVFNQMVPGIKDQLNQHVEQFGIFLVLAIVLLVVLILQPLIGIFQLLLFALNGALFYTLFRTGVLKKSVQQVDKETVSI